MINPWLTDETAGAVVRRIRGRKIYRPFIPGTTVRKAWLAENGVCSDCSGEATVARWVVDRLVALCRPCHMRRLGMESRETKPDQNADTARAWASRRYARAGGLKSWTT